MLAFADWSSTDTHYQVRYFSNVMHYMECRLGLCVKKDTVALSKLYKKVCKHANIGHKGCVYIIVLAIKHHLFDRSFWGS
jgi:hypothetical protein